MKKMVVCGDSFMSPVIDETIGLHFTELLADRMGWELIPLARGGVGNNVIRLQIEESISMDPDCVIIGLTSPDRFEFPLHRGEHNFLPHAGLSNINYEGYPDSSSNNILFEIVKPTLHSVTLSNVFNKNNEPSFNVDEIDTLRKWFNLFYDHNYKTQQDAWAIYGGLRRLEDLDIPFYCINHTLGGVDDFQEFGEKIIYSGSDLDPWEYMTNNTEHRFHTSLESQYELYLKWYNRFIEDGLI
jgi:hypothetical protein